MESNGILAFVSAFFFQQQSPSAAFLQHLHNLLLPVQTFNTEQLSECRIRYRSPGRISQLSSYRESAGIAVSGSLASNMSSSKQLLTTISSNALKSLTLSIISKTIPMEFKRKNRTPKSTRTRSATFQQRKQKKDITKSNCTSTITRSQHWHKVLSARETSATGQEPSVFADTSTSFNLQQSLRQIIQLPSRM